LNGDGIALGWSFYIDDLLRTNRLRLPGNRRVRTERGFFCCISDHGLHKPAARDFANWLHKAVELKPL
jgi:DNA-binding transcriptional LysR family regulator